MSQTASKGAAPGKALRPIDQTRAELTKMAPQFEAALPRSVPVERFTRVLMTAISANPDLLECDRMSLLASAMTAAQLGLYTDGFLGEGYLIPYKGKVTLVPGYRGLMKLARQSGEVISISAHVVYRTDKFSYAFGDDEHIRHVPDVDTDPKPGDITFAYAIAKLKDGGIQRHVMSRAQLDAVRNASPGKNQAPWRDHYAAMAEKTVLRRLCGRLPLSTEAQQAVAVAEVSERGARAYIDHGVMRIEEDAEAQPQESKPAEKGTGTSRMDAAASDQGAAKGPVIEGKAEDV